MDLTSFKKEPVKLMLANSKAQVIGCHPLFGPQLKDVSGQNVVLCPARGKNWLCWLKSVFKKNKMAVWESTPEKHDKMMAVIQALNHLNTISLGMAIARTNITFEDINKFSTPIFRTKLEIIRKVFTESPELYLDIITGNPQTNKMLDIYEQALKDIRAKIKSGSKAKSKIFLEKSDKKTILIKILTTMHLPVNLPVSMNLTSHIRTHFIDNDLCRIRQYGNQQYPREI